MLRGSLVEIEIGGGLFEIKRGGGVLEMGGIVVVLQQGPVQLSYFLRSLDVFRDEHLTWSQAKHVEHCTDVEPMCFVHTGQNQGPGFCSMPAINSSSRIRPAGNFLFFVKHIKNTVLLREDPHCRST